MSHHCVCRQLGPIAKSLSPVLYNSTLQELARSIIMINDNAFTADDVCDDNVFMMTLMNMLTLKTPSPNVNSDNHDGDVETFPRSTPDLLALMEAFAFSINSPVLQKVLLIIVTVIIKGLYNYHHCLTIIFLPYC